MNYSCSEERKSTKAQQIAVRMSGLKLARAISQRILFFIALKRTFLLDVYQKRDTEVVAITQMVADRYMPRCALLLNCLLAIFGPV